jgi:hypothetical protein
MTSIWHQAGMLRLGAPEGSALLWAASGPFQTTVWRTEQTSLTNVWFAQLASWWTI